MRKKQPRHQPTIIQLQPGRTAERVHFFCPECADLTPQLTQATARTGRSPPQIRSNATALLNSNAIIVRELHNGANQLDTTTVNAVAEATAEAFKAHVQERHVERASRVEELQARSRQTPGELKNFFLTRGNQSSTAQKTNSHLTGNTSRRNTKSTSLQLTRSGQMNSMLRN